MLLALLLCPDVSAAETAKIKNIRITQTTGNGTYMGRSIGVSTSSDIDSTTLELKVGNDTESISLVESNVVAHGTTLLTRLPPSGSSTSIKVYDGKGGLLQTFNGKADNAGNLSFSASTSSLDLELLGTQIIDDKGGYTLNMELNGADAWSAASAILSWEETTCSKLKGCYSTFYSTTIIMDSLDSFWEGTPSLEMTGLMELKATSYDSNGKKVDEEKVKQSLPWENEGSGLPVVTLEEDPLTSLAYLGGKRGYGMGKFGGEPIGFEMTVGKTPITVVPPAVLLMSSSNGSGTRNVAATANQTQSTWLL